MEQRIDQRRLARLPRRRRWLTPALATAMAVAMTHCSKQQALLLTVQSAQSIDQFDLRVRDVASGDIVLERAGEPVDPARDQLRVSVEFARRSNYLVYVSARAAVGDAAPLFALRDFQVDGVVERTLQLQPLVGDADADGYPACGTAGLNCNAVACNFLDCDDGDAAVSPFGREVCGNGKDDDCSGRCNGGAPDLACTDNDGDGVPAPEDCDDDDPCRSPRLAERGNLCGQSEALPSLPQACLDRLTAEGKSSSSPYCGDGIDQDCDGRDATCAVDEDCDGISPPQDCDDGNAAVNPSATEICDGVDNDCDRLTDEGCLPCDVDGDGHAAVGSSDPNCVGGDGNPLPADDADDFDAGRFPGSTDGSAGLEGGSVAMALRGYCRASTNKDGQSERMVDHDGDGLAAEADGCPAISCDADGDGFANAQCDPPPPRSLEDCDDSDPEVFPGAPDKCGDGLKQDCVADQACAQVTDVDGDGYAAGVDCADDDPERHPWATEVCDGLDNDCDGLIDEGNPDHSGGLIPTAGAAGRLCNDNNLGRCGGESCNVGEAGCSAAGRALSGVCACSRAEPNGQRNANNRVSCSGEDLSALASSRCFGAIQPQSERCDVEDWDCNGRADDPAGANPMVDQGKACGTDVGRCRAGVVKGCDLSQAVPPDLPLIQSVLAVQGIEFNRFWVCEPTGQVVLPRAEQCNGEDDDCNGQTPANEADADNDGSRICDGDCAPTNPAVFPGAPELCNGIDDNCSAGTSDDGSDQCRSGFSCCSASRSCRQLLADPLHCGQCGRRCDSVDVDRCVNGDCVCGQTGGRCPAGLDCVNGQCRCLAGGRCSGCCDGDTCVISVSTSRCGSNGEACRDCDDGQECTADSCSNGSCQNNNRPSTESCNSNTGRCLNGVCCGACIGGSSCLPGLDNSACGGGGSLCEDCRPGTCRQGSCCRGNYRCWTGSDCVNGRNDDQNCGREGNDCQDCGAQGQCHDGQCCSGSFACFDGFSCVDGQSNATACGAGGQNCQDCGSAGQCYDGQCCSGTYACHDGGSCVDGQNNSSACGRAGLSCQNCGSQGQCYDGQCCSGTYACHDGNSCVDGQSNSSACGRNGQSCQDCGGGVCTDGQCCSGATSCWNGSACVDGQSDAVCGKDGQACADCTPGGTCRAGSCCSGGFCWNGSTCVDGSSVSECGAGGGDCQDCGADGQCYSGQCCSGSTMCWQSSSSSCVNGESNDEACGVNGLPCENCTMSGESCVSGACE